MDFDRYLNGLKVGILIWVVKILYYQHIFFDLDHRHTPQVL
jgi:hypothetical protein